jgi:hypothetical protein
MDEQKKPRIEEDIFQSPTMFYQPPFEDIFLEYSIPMPIQNH